MGNLLALSQLALQGLMQIQSYQETMQRALAEGRDVSLEDLATARAALQSHLDGFQALIDSRKGAKT
jgi:hypothetical protein